MGLVLIESLIKVYSDYQSCLYNTKLCAYCFSSHSQIFIDLNKNKKNKPFTLCYTKHNTANGGLSSLYNISPPCEVCRSSDEQSRDITL